MSTRNAVRLHAVTAERPVQNREAERQNRANKYLRSGATLFFGNPFIGVARLTRTMGMANSSGERHFSKRYLADSAPILTSVKINDRLRVNVIRR